MSKSSKPYTKKNKEKILPKTSVNLGKLKTRRIDSDKNNPDLIYGCHSALSVLQSEKQLNRIYITSKLAHDSRFQSLITDAKANGAVVDIVDNNRLNQITNFANHQGIALSVAPYEYLDLQELITVAKNNHDNPVIIIADGINDPHNLGAIIRTAEALGIQGLVIPQRRSASVTSTVFKVAAGALEYFPIARVVNLNQAIAELKEAGFWIYGTVAESDNGNSLHKIKWEGAVGLVVGSEEKGISQSTEKICDFLVSIPMNGKTPSLNASVATAICIYEICRQRLTR